MKSDAQVEREWIASTKKALDNIEITATAVLEQVFRLPKLIESLRASQAEMADSEMTGFARQLERSLSELTRFGMQFAGIRDRAWELKRAI